MNGSMELLAPAGNMECLHAALRSGADAVYLGLDRFNARRGADNFTLDTLAEACDYAHLRSARIYLTVNTVILPGERQAAMEMVRQAYVRGVDGFIVQDLGLAHEMRRTLPEAKLHVSTQMNVHNAAGIEAAARMGASRVTLARELNLAEIAYLCERAADAGMEVETFGHGAICICYSGQCLISSLIGGRSANRGMCAQACRLPYELHNRAQRKPLDAPGEHLLSPKDLCTVDLLPELALCGVSSLKIEGRMKSPEYVAAVTGVYRAVLDRVLAWGNETNAWDAEEALDIPETLRATDEEKRVLAEAFSRGFTSAYLTGKDGNDMMSYGRPNNRGVLVGRVEGAHDGAVTVDLERPLAVGDVVEFWTNRGHFAHTVTSEERLGGKRATLHVERKVSKGDRMFRVRSAEAAFTDNANEPRVGVHGAVAVRIGEPLRLVLRTDAGVEAAAEGPVVETARTKAVTADDVRAHIDRFGNSPFTLLDLDVQLDEGAGLGFSQLHKVRQQAADALEAAIVAPYRSRKLAKTEHAAVPSRAFTRTKPIVVALATNPACARAAKKAGADALYVPALNYKRGESMVAGQLSETVAQAGYPKKMRIMLPTIDHDPLPGTREEKLGFDPWRYVKPGHTVIADNFGQIRRALDAGAEVEAGPHVLAMNPWAVNALAEAGVSRVWLSPELTLGQIQDIASESSVPLGLAVSGANELMVTEHCLLMSQGACNRDCSTCARRKSPHYLKDRKEYEMPVFTDCCGRSHLYNAVPLDIVHLMPDLIAAGIDALMVDATLLNVEETKKAVTRAAHARDIAHRSDSAVQKAPGTTTGHIFRSIQ